jgi:hypothetical protein
LSESGHSPTTPHRTADLLRPQREIGHAARVSMTSAITAGWYPDQPRRHRARYWDGQQWTAWTADVPQPFLDLPRAPEQRASWRTPRVTWVSVAVSLVWCVLVAGALVWTLNGVSPSHPFDGLNNLFQIPFALPWFLIPSGVHSQRTDAWIAASYGWLNGVLILVFLDGWFARLRLNW